MLGFLGGALGGIANAIGGYLSNQNTIAANIKMQKDAQKFSREEAVTSRNWSEKMSNTSYQRGMADMRAAGLNPILAADQGGATTPNAAMATSPGGSVPKLANWLGDGVSSALDLYRGIAAVQNVDADTKLKEAQAQQVPAATDKLRAEIENLAGVRLPPGAMANLNEAQIRQVLAGATAHLASAGESSAHASVYKRQEEVQTYVRDFLRKHHMYPGTDTGVGAFGIRSGPTVRHGEGVGGMLDSFGGMLQSGYNALFGNSAQIQTDQLRNKAAEAIKVVIRAQDQRTPPGERRHPAPRQQPAPWQQREDLR